MKAPRHIVNSPHTTGNSSTHGISHQRALGRPGPKIHAAIVSTGSPKCSTTSDHGTVIGMPRSPACHISRAKTSPAVIVQLSTMVRMSVSQRGSTGRRRATRPAVMATAVNAMFDWIVR